MAMPMRASNNPSAPKITAGFEESETGAGVGAGLGVDAAAAMMRCARCGKVAVGL
jgi:hypothetical protein